MMCLLLSRGFLKWYWRNPTGSTSAGAHQTTARSSTKSEPNLRVRSPRSQLIRKPRFQLAAGTPQSESV